MPHVHPLPWEANPQFRERFENYRNTPGLVRNSILTVPRRAAISGCR